MMCSQQPPVDNQNRQTVLVQSRLNPPALPDILVGRSRIQSRLALIPDHKLTLLTAPTGYGKTTAVLYWIQQQGVPAGWLTFLNAQDNLFTFLIYLVASLQRLCPGLCEKTEQLVHGGQAPESAERVSSVSLPSRGRLERHTQDRLRDSSSSNPLRLAGRTVRGTGVWSG